MAMIYKKWVWAESQMLPQAMAGFQTKLLRWQFKRRSLIFKEAPDGEMV